MIPGITAWKVAHPNGYGGECDVRVMTDDIEEVVLFGSRTKDDYHQHKILLDVDHRVSVYPSSTVGHHHLYIDVSLSWRKYRRLLKALAKAGVIEPGYYRASRSRGMTFLRAPWVKKKDSPLSGTYKGRFLS